MEDLQVLRLRAISLASDIAALKQWAQVDAERAAHFSQLLESADGTVARVLRQVEFAETSIVAAVKEEPPRQPDPNVGDGSAADSSQRNDLPGAAR
ncbi:hypothetical protein [Kitasatospora sp. NPDC050543]|uniref:hypothetical protein n=1 Tax=Kitasatospora sp. NPDC050543 TaxID=3364054 RepID=UPI0037A21000